MKFYDAEVLKDAKSSKERRFRNILANSGQIMESGEIRDLENLYVMGRDGKPIAIKTLNQNPEKQTEEYVVKAQADHGELVDGELVDTIEKQFGSCRVWMEEDGLHARMYFADNDVLADHAFAISEDASYSTGIDWYPDGYYGVGLDIEEPIGILREISMVVTGNDPRAKTIDHKEAEAIGAKGSDVTEAEDGNNTNENGESEMSAKTQDELTPDENAAIKQKLAEELVEKAAEVVNEFTTEVPESEVQPTARDEKQDEPEVEESKDSEEVTTETEAPAVEAETKDAVVHNININFRDRAVKNEMPVVSKDTKLEAKNARANIIRDALRASNFKFNDKFNAALTTKDEITGLDTPLNITNIFTDAMDHADGILSYIYHIGGTNGRGLRNNVLAGTEGVALGAAGHLKGDTKRDQELENTIRAVYNKMIYKKLALDAMEIYENPELLEFRARELFDQIILSVERAIFIGDGRDAPSDDEADLRMFDSTTNTGLFPIATDCASTSGYGSLVASTYSVSDGDNLYDGIVGGRQYIRTEGEQILVVKPSVLAGAFQAKVDSRYLIEPGATAEDIFRVARVFAPQWMEADETNDAYLLVRNGYTTTGERSPRVYPFFDVSNNQNILLNEMPLGGTLTKYKSAVAINGLS